MSSRFRAVSVQNHTLYAPAGRVALVLGPRSVRSCRNRTRNLRTRLHTGPSARTASRSGIAGGKKGTTSLWVKGARSSSTNCNSRDASSWASYESRSSVSEETHSVLSHRGAAMVDKTWLNLAAEREIALATWGLYLSDLREGEARRGEGGCCRETIAAAGGRKMENRGPRWRFGLCRRAPSSTLQPSQVDRVRPHGGGWPS